MINDVKQDAGTRMQKTLQALRDGLKKIRAGRAHASLLDGIQVTYYDASTPLSQVASVVASDARTLTVTPWDKTVVAAVDKAIRESGLGVNPVLAGEVIRVPVPLLTEERRLQLGKLVRGEGENSRVAIRNIRRDALSTLKDLQKEKEISADEEKDAGDDIQTLTDKAVAEIDDLVKLKEADLLEV
ncbi:MAG: ribosome recycling factor [Gammaproteobacteria bacterium]|nr:MAG: ribosome recycling factor [Gammaproteobacteria bacterium]RLA11003.1 MAG: ribosome recycling factor [Gammaproteobacteria bacterium]RLA15248.1 MAG: ribosome recycling factor [Gammaproteobacteria bacterium]